MPLHSMEHALYESDDIIEKSSNVSTGISIYTHVQAIYVMGW